MQGNGAATVWVALSAIFPSSNFFWCLFWVLCLFNWANPDLPLQMPAGFFRKMPAGFFRGLGFCAALFLGAILSQTDGFRVANPR